MATNNRDENGELILTPTELQHLRAMLLETAAAHLSAIGRPFDHLIALLDDAVTHNRPLEGKRLGYAVADVIAIRERLDELLEWLQEERKRGTVLASKNLTLPFDVLPGGGKKSG